MSNWLNRLDLKDLWVAKEKEIITIQDLGTEVSKRIKKLKCYKKEIDILEEIAYNFSNVLDVEDFDGILSELYDWGDMLIDHKGIMANKMCWIATF